MTLKLVEKWDKVFPKSDKVNHRKVSFRNHFGVELAADLYEPKESSGRLPAIAVAGSYGAVKEQSSGLYAQEMAERVTNEQMKEYCTKVFPTLKRWKKD